MGRDDLGRGERVVAACLAGLWLAGGVTGVAVGLWLRAGLVPTAVGLLALAYGVIWLRVTLTGRRQRWPPRKGRPR